MAQALLLPAAKAICPCDHKADAWTDPIQPQKLSRASLLGLINQVKEHLRVPRQMDHWNG